MSRLTLEKTLIIEDDDFYFESLRRHFKMSSQQVFHANCYQAALNAIDDNKFDLIVIDPGLPDFGELKENDKTRYSILNSVISKTPSAMHIVITGRFSTKEAELCKQLGAKGYFNKSRLNAPTLAALLAQMSQTDFILHTGDNLTATVIRGNPDLSYAEEECLQWVEQRPQNMKRKDLFSLMAQHFNFKNPEVAEQKYKRARSKVLLYQQRLQSNDDDS